MQQFMSQVYAGNRTSLTDQDISVARDLIEYACRRIGMRDPRPTDPCARLDFMLVEAYLMGISGQDWTEVERMVAMLMPSIPPEHQPLIRRTLQTLHQNRSKTVEINQKEAQHVNSTKSTQNAPKNAQNPPKSGEITSLLP